MSTPLSRFITLVAFVLLFCTAVGQAQPEQVNDAEFGVIPDSLSELQPPEEYEDLPYMFTNKERDISFRQEGNSIVAILEHHVRLKVFDHTAREASIIAIPYYFDDDMEQISDISGWTHLPSGRSVAVQEDDIRTVNINSRYNVKEFTMPQVMDGAILEYRYTIQRRYIEELPTFFLSHKVPTAAAKMTITYPRYLRYQVFKENFDRQLNHDFVYTDTSSVPKIFVFPQPDPVVTERWMAYNIAPTEEEPFISTLDDHRAKLEFLLSEFGIPRQVLETSWEIVVAKMRRKTNPWTVIRKNSLARAKGDSIAEALPSAPQQAVQDSIYRYLNSRVNFSGAHTPYSQEKDTAALKGEPVNQAAINQTLLAMLQGADINADPVMISTRQSGSINKDFPSFYQFNGQMIRSEIGDQEFLLDASFPHSQPGLIPRDMYSGPGLILDENSFQWMEFEPRQSSFNIQVDVDADLQPDGSLSGNITAQQGGYPAQQIRQQRADGMGDVEILRNTLFDGYTNISLEDAQISHINEYESPVEMSAEFEIDDYATSFSNGLEYRPMIVGNRSENPFEDKSRDLPITLDAPENLDFSYSISLPPGYSAETDKGKQSLEFEGAAFEESYDMTDDQLNYDFNIDIEDHQFSTDQFPRLYELYERWVNLSNATWLIENQ